MMRLWMPLVTLVLFAGLFLGSGTHAGAANDQPTLDELLDLVPAETQTPEGAAEDSAASEDASGDDALADELEELRQSRLAEYQEAAGAFESAVADMEVVADRLSDDHDPALDTQRRQEQIIKKLEQMIAAAKKMESSGGASSSSSKPRGQDAGTEQMAGQSQGQAQGLSQGQAEHRGDVSPGSVGPTSPDTLKPLEELEREWGNLPPRLRDELSEGLNEAFSPLYRRMTRSYYERLAEESGEAAAP